MATFTIEEFKEDVPNFVGFIRLHLAAGFSLDENTPNELEALLKTNLGIRMYVDKINAVIEKQSTRR